jgi:hypothetical protein
LGVGFGGSSQGFSGSLCLGRSSSSRHHTRSDILRDGGRRNSGKSLSWTCNRGYLSRRDLVESKIVDIDLLGNRSRILKFLCSKRGIF